MINHAATIPLHQEHQIGRCYVFMYFTSKNSWRCLIWGVTLLLMWHALQIRALGWIKVVQGGCGLMIAFSSVSEGHFANPQPPLKKKRWKVIWRLLCGGWKGWILIISIYININRNVCCKENCSNLHLRSHKTTNKAIWGLESRLEAICSPLGLETLERFHW